MNRTPISTEEIARVLELSHAEVLACSLAELQALAKRRRRELATQHHPDTGGSGARMAEINRVCDHVERSEIFHRPPPIDPRTIQRPPHLDPRLWAQVQQMEQASRNRGRPWGSGADFFGPNARYIVDRFAAFIQEDQAKRRAAAEKLRNQAECGTLYPE